MNYITFKVKTEQFQDANDLRIKEGFKLKKSLTKNDCTLKPHQHSFYNSDLFAGILNRKYKELVNNNTLLFVDNLPEHIKIINQGFLSLVKIELPLNFK